MAGAHMPMLFYVGDKSRRSKAALDRRELAQIERGWGPGSDNRARLHGRGEGKGKDKRGSWWDQGKGWGQGKGWHCGKDKDKG